LIYKVEGTSPSPQPSPAPTYSLLNSIAKAGEGFFKHRLFHPSQYSYIKRESLLGDFKASDAEEALSRLSELFNLLEVGAGEGWGEGEVPLHPKPLKYWLLPR